MTNLFIWYPTIVRREKGIPQNDNMWIREKFVQGKEIEGLNYDWLDYDYAEHGFPPKSNSLKLPKELFFIFQKDNSLLFDFLPYRKNMFIVSREFRQFIEEHYIDKPLEFSKLIIIHKLGKEVLTKKEYFLMRVATFDDDLFEFVEDGKKPAAGLRGEFLYPNLKLRGETNQGIFFLNDFCYSEALVFTERIKDKIKELFYCPEIYRVSDFYLAFNNNNTARKDNLPETV